MTSPSAHATPAAPTTPRDVVGPLKRGLALLRHVATAGGRQPVSELTRAVGLARSSVDRLLSTLHRLGYVDLDGREVALAPRVAELGNAYMASSGLVDRIGALADELADELDESVSLAVPDRDVVRFVHQAARRRAMSLSFRIGDLLPVERGAPGALFAAFWNAQDWQYWRSTRATDRPEDAFRTLPPSRADHTASFEQRVQTARDRGWSLDDQLIEPGLLAVAVPVRDATGHPVCAVSVVSHTSRHSVDSLQRAVLRRLHETAAHMEEELQAPPRPAAGTADAAGTACAVSAREAKRELGPGFVESLARGLTVLTTLGTRTGGMTLTALAETTGLARATTRRSLITLEHLGYVENRARTFHLTPRVLELGFAHLSAMTLDQIAQPHLTALVRRVRESASMSVLRGEDIQYVARVPTVHIMSVNITVGTRFPAHATSMGRVLLAGLPRQERASLLASMEPEPLTEHTVTSTDQLTVLLDETAHQGYAMVGDELEDGLRSLAVPVHDGAGHTVAAVNVSTHSRQSTAQQSCHDLLPPLGEAARAIEADLRIVGRYARIATA